MLFEKSFDEILAEAQKELVNNTKITRVSPGAKARSLLEVLARTTNDAYKTFDLNLARAFVSGANGKFLDYIGELVGLERLGLKAASASINTKAVRFFVESGLFSSINLGSPITIPANTIISTEADGGIRYRVPISVTLAGLSSSQYVPVEAILPGSTSNIGTNQLIVHDFTGYADIANSTLKVTNDQGIFNGQDIESDTNYRFRITRQVTAAECANLTAIRLAVLGVPGIADMLFVPFSRGIGTFDVLIKSVTPQVSDSLLEAVQSAIEEVTAQGIVGLAKKPTEVGITFTLTIIYAKSISSTERANVESRVRQALTNYVNSLDIGESFIINEAVQRVMDVDDRIKDIGEPGKPFDEITIYKPTKLQDNKIKSTLLKNYPTEDNERLIIEPSIVTPILISTAI